jgi:putative two-component system response regulator
LICFLKVKNGNKIRDTGPPLKGYFPSFRGVSGVFCGKQEERMTARKLVMAIDDDPDILDFIQSVLSPHYDVKTGCSGGECLNLVASVHPDVILLDVIMEHLGDGLDCLRKLKGSPGTKSIPVVMMTSVNDVYDYRSQIEASFYKHDRWLDKPVNPDVLLKTVREVAGS